MITIKGSIWHKDDYRFVSDVIAIGISEACEDYEQNCDKCKVRHACRELRATKDYCDLKV